MRTQELELLTFTEPSQSPAVPGLNPGFLDSAHSQDGGALIEKVFVMDLVVTESRSGIGRVASYVFVELSSHPKLLSHLCKFHST